MEPITSSRRQEGARSGLSLLFRTDPTVLGTDVAVVPVRIALVWIFTYYGAGKLFGWFNGPGIHRTAIFFSETAHLHPGGFFAVLGGIIEFGGAVALALGVFSRLAALTLFGDQVMAMITVSWAHGINSLSATPGYEFNVALAVMALVIVGLGAGRPSLDAVIARHLRTSAPPATTDMSDRAQLARSGPGFG
jgi:putative oxidoreductase